MYRNLSFTEIMKRLRRPSSEYEFYALQTILTDREKNAQIMIENLTTALHSLKEEVISLERSKLVAESDKSKTEEMLQSAQSKLEEMNEAITRLENQNSECREKLKCSDTKIAEKGKEIEDLKHQKSTSENMVDELRRRNFENDKVVEELKRQNDELRGKNVELDKELVLRIKKLEQKIAELWKYRESSWKLGDQHANKIAPASSPVVDVIEIPDDDEETNPNAAAPITDIVEAASNAGEKEMMILDQNPPCSPTKKRSRTDSEDVHLMNTSTKTERSISERNPNDLPSGCGFLSDKDSTDSDDDLSFSDMENLVAELQSKIARQKSMNEVK